MSHYIPGQMPYVEAGLQHAAPSVGVRRPRPTTCYGATVLRVSAEHGPTEVGFGRYIDKGFGPGNYQFFVSL